MAKLGSSRVLCGLLSALLILEAASSSLSSLSLSSSSSPPLLWPLPAQASFGADVVTVIPSTTFFSTVGGSSSLLQGAFDRYMQLTFSHAVSATDEANDPFRQQQPLLGAFVLVDDWSEDYPQLETDESYNLTVDQSETATIRAKTVFGALRGLETLSQLIKYNFDTAAYELQGAPLFIADSPRFPHRGLMVDTGRHYLPLSALRSIIDSLPYIKLNVLHWHMVDTQSFPFQSKSNPKLWQGAYSGPERYTQADVAAIVDYARLRGVRVIVEFDMPGHAQSWCKGYPEICPSPTCLTPLNMANTETFQRIAALIEEVTGGKPSAKGSPSGLFPDNFMHLGGDEVETGCWGKTPAIADWLRARNMTEDDGYAYFVKRVAKMVIDTGHRPMQWSEVFDHFKGKLPKETVIHVWKDVTNVTEVVSLGYNVVRNVGYNNVSWYLDNLNVMWDAVYQNEPCQGIPSQDLCNLVLGGHGEMWGETVDASDLQQTTFPRLAAIAERLWSPRNTTQDLSAAAERLRSFRCLLLERGIAAAPIDNKNAREAPSGPASCYSQPGASTKEVLVV
mmetsp:Transcript_71233/g.148955  ORF Transcript_71233/g.148955 Transcript_71233/m.148955 type:complete len:563 (-) Transcript_71233:343-2031(-)